MYWTISGKRALSVAGAGLILLTATFWSLSRTGARAPASADGGDWGLHFPKEGRPPTGNATADFLAGYGAVYLGDTNRPRLYLTFDAGYENGYTASILDTLKKHGVPAAFFLVGHYVESAPDLTRRMREEGHIVGNHTYHHPNMTALTDKAAFAEELTALETRYKEVTGYELSRFYRPPQGKFSEQNLALAQELGYRTVFWSLAYVDWRQDRQPTHEEAFGKLLPRTHPGAIILLHTTSKTNAEILDALLTKWTEMGYSFGTLDEL
ncbi:MAG: polysaccharide deacetylase family protein [Oscillospiraceae bacterium]|jgi:peptidoglycan-N-acetylmuramic acid deacetylase|nr:polysaccharide deacetylase family protein [Oscillospiraceae bacterium]